MFERIRSSRLDAEPQYLSITSFHSKWTWEIGQNCRMATFSKTNFLFIIHRKKMPFKNVSFKNRKTFLTVFSHEKGLLRTFAVCMFKGRISTARSRPLLKVLSLLSSYHADEEMYTSTRSNATGEEIYVDVFLPSIDFFS